MRIVQPHLNSCFTQTHTQHITYPHSLPRVSLAAGPQPAKTSPVSNGVLRNMATPCSNCRLTRASRISVRADLSPSSKLVGPSVDKKIIEKQNTETGALKKPTETLNTGSNNRTSSVPKRPIPNWGCWGYIHIHCRPDSAFAWTAKERTRAVG